MTEPLLAQKGPFETPLEAGKEYYWCACGRSKTQPFCDGSHKGTGLAPVRYVADKTRTVFFCGCKRSGRKPICDGTHSRL
ncbi:MAG TPA: CDGSH iron-sulfur domain-containing protein [Alphaproteobacteria bacterium]|nr:CDGSH iron-sulfur domain-containing protein [Alphaproteobacteria bacterium]